MASPVSFLPVPQRTHYDCGIAALAMLLGLDYLTVRGAVKTPVEDGLTCSQMVTVAKRLGRTLINIPSLNIPEDRVGILAMRKGNCYHSVLLFNGTICDPDGCQMWEADVFCKVTRYKPYRFLSL